MFADSYFSDQIFVFREEDAIRTPTWGARLDDARTEQRYRHGPDAQNAVEKTSGDGTNGFDALILWKDENVAYL